MNLTIAAALGVYFSALLFIALLRKTQSSSGHLYLIRALLPSWRFFETVSELPELRVRIEKDGAFGEWQPLLPDIERSWGTLFSNPQGNYLLACQTLLTQLAEESARCPEGEGDRLAESVSYRLVQNLVRFELRKRSAVEDSAAYQFKLVAKRQGSAAEEDVLFSLAHKA